jgi:hypothetical protein
MLLAIVQRDMKPNGPIELPHDDQEQGSEIIIVRRQVRSG